MHGICKSKLTISNLNRRISAFDITAASRHDLARAGRLARHCSSRAAGTPWNNCSSKKGATKMAEQTHHTPNKTLGTGPTFGICVLKVSKSYFHVLRLFLPTVFSDAVIGPIAKSFFDSLIIGPIP